MDGSRGASAWYPPSPLGTQLIQLLLKPLPTRTPDQRPVNGTASELGLWGQAGTRLPMNAGTVGPEDQFPGAAFRDSVLSFQSQRSVGIFWFLRVILNLSV